MTTLGVYQRSFSSSIFFFQTFARQMCCRNVVALNSLVSFGTGLIMAITEAVACSKEKGCSVHTSSGSLLSRCPTHVGCRRGVVVLFVFYYCMCGLFPAEIIAAIIPIYIL